jgi:protein-tyrosine phosphatase
MPEVLDWRQVQDLEEAARFAVDALQGGQVVLFPTECGYALGASILHSDAIARVRQRVPEQPLELVVRGRTGACAWLPDLGTAGQRLARRFWPGPLTLAGNEGIEQGEIGRLAESVRTALCMDGLLHLRQPLHPAVGAALDRLGAPLAVAAVLDSAAGPLPLAGALERLGDGIDVVIDDGPVELAQPATIVEANGSQWLTRRPGVLSVEVIREGMVCLIVFVCTGNTCRSPMAEAIFKRRLADRLGCAPADLPGRGFLVLSAGLAAMPDMPAAEEAVEVAHALGTDLTAHQSRLLGPDLAEQADLLVGMTAGHLQAMRDYFSVQARLLSPGGEDVADPVGQPREVYEACARQMAGYLDHLVEELLQ